MAITKAPAPPGKNWGRLTTNFERTWNTAYLLYRKMGKVGAPVAFDKVMDGCKKIFSLSFPRDREHLLVKSVTVFADSLVRQKQLGLARQVLDAALSVVRFKIG